MWCPQRAHSLIRLFWYGVTVYLPVIGTDSVPSHTGLLLDHEAVEADGDDQVRHAHDGIDVARKVLRLIVDALDGVPLAVDEREQRVRTEAADVAVRRVVR